MAKRLAQANFFTCAGWIAAVVVYALAGDLGEAGGAACLAAAGMLGALWLGGAAAGGRMLLKMQIRRA